MCIVCNVGDIGDEFLSADIAVKSYMRKAKKAMLAASKATNDPDISRSYDRAHKRICYLIREWNRIEEQRESYQNIPVENIDWGKK